MQARIEKEAVRQFCCAAADRMTRCDAADRMTRCDAADRNISAARTFAEMLRKKRRVTWPELNIVWRYHSKFSDTWM
ncbi:MAG: hypothetical protein ACRYFU_26270 [Janthinobacterium lividum]